MTHPSAGVPSVPDAASAYARRCELADFAARTCYTLWHGASYSQDLNEFSPRSIFYSTPESFLRLVRRTLHPHISSHTATVALLYIQRYVNCKLHKDYLSEMPLRTPPPSPAFKKGTFSKPGPGSEARIWCIALLLAIKQNDDRAAAARSWPPARVEEAAGGMTALELAAMEREFLVGIDWRLRITPEEYSGWLQRLRRFKEVIEAPLRAQKEANERKRCVDTAELDRSPCSVMSVANLVSKADGSSQPPRKKSFSHAEAIGRSIVCVSGEAFKSAKVFETEEAQKINESLETPLGDTDSP